MQLEDRLQRLDDLFPPGEATRPLKVEDRQISEGPSTSHIPAPDQQEYDSDNDNISEAGQAFDDAAETAAMLLEEKTLG